MRTFAIALLLLGLAGCLPPEAEAQCRRGATYRSSYYANLTYYAPRQAYAPRDVPGEQYAAERPQPGRRERETAPAPRTAYRQPIEPEPAADDAVRSLDHHAASPSQAESLDVEATVVRVGAHDNYFEPKTIAVPPGTTIRWTNLGQHKHTVTSDGNAWDSGDMLPGAAYEATFRSEGTYRFFCRHHGEMSGSIVVSDRLAAPPEKVSDERERARAPRNGTEERQPSQPPRREY